MCRIFFCWYKTLSNIGKKKTRWRPFEEWLRQEVKTEFGLNRVFEADYPHAFIADLPTLTPEEHQQAEALRKKLAFFADSWNQDDLKMNFIGQFLQIIDFQELKYRVFYNVFLKTTLSWWCFGKRFAIAEQTAFFSTSIQARK